MLEPAWKAAMECCAVRTQVAHSGLEMEAGIEQVLVQEGWR